MKTRNLFLTLSFFSLALSFVACKKTADQEPEPPAATALSSKDPQALSAAVKVWHGERLQGTAPAPKGSALQLDASASAPLTLAFAGRYAIIKPEIAQGDVSGYYLQFNGAREYFKIDYSKPRGGRFAAGKKPANPFGKNGREARVQNGNADSAIVVALPANLKVPDTFCVSYCAYDATGNVSNVLTTCIVVNSLGTDAAGNWVNGTWRNTASYDTTGNYRDTVVFNRWMAVPYHSGYECHYDSATGTSFPVYNSGGGSSIVTDSINYQKAHLTLGTNGGSAYEYHEKAKYLNHMASTCTQFVFQQEDFQENFTGAWNYNAATGKMVLIFEFDYSGVPTLEAWEYKVIKVNNNNMVLVEDATGYPYYYRFEK